MPEKQERQAIDPDLMLESGVGGRWVNQGDEPELRNPREPAKLRAIDQVAHPLCEWNIQLRRESNHPAGGIQSRNLGYRSDIRHQLHHPFSPISRSL